MCDRDQDLITLTHVCRAWRVTFISQSFLWADIDCVDPDKTRVCFKRSKSPPISLSLHGTEGLSPSDPFVRIIPHARLKSLSVTGARGNLNNITAHLPRPAPLLQDMSIYVPCVSQQVGNPVLTPTLFGGDLSSLRKLHLGCVCTGLPWRNMVNLTSFVLIRTSPIPARQLLDFLEGVPHLREVELQSKVSTPGAQYGRLVSPAYLKRMYAIDGDSSSPLLDPLLIPVGAHLTIVMELSTPQSSR